MYVIKMVAIQKFFCDPWACHPDEPGGDAPPSPMKIPWTNFCIQIQICSSPDLNLPNPSNTGDGLDYKIQLFLFKSELDNSSFKDCASFVSIWLTDIM